MGCHFNCSFRSLSNTKESNSIANIESTYGLRMNWTPDSSKVVLLLTNAILAVVSGTLAMQTKIFIGDRARPPRPRWLDCGAKYSQSDASVNYEPAKIRCGQFHCSRENVDNKLAFGRITLDNFAP